MAELSGKTEDFWRNVKGLVCVCKFYDCSSEDCRLVKHLLEEIQEWRKKKKNV